MTFTEAKQQFDSLYENAIDFQCFIQEHLTFSKTICLSKISFRFYNCREVRAIWDEEKFK